MADSDNAIPKQTDDNGSTVESNEPKTDQSPTSEVNGGETRKAGKDSEDITVDLHVQDASVTGTETNVKEGVVEAKAEEHNSKVTSVEVSATKVTSEEASATKVKSEEATATTIPDKLDAAETDRTVDTSKDEKSVDTSKDEKPVDTSKDEKSVDTSKDKKPVDTSKAEKPVDTIKDEKSVTKEDDKEQVSTIKSADTTKGKDEVVKKAAEFVREGSETPDLDENKLDTALTSNSTKQESDKPNDLPVAASSVAPEATDNTVVSKVEKDMKPENSPPAVTTTSEDTKPAQAAPVTPVKDVKDSSFTETSPMETDKEEPEKDQSDDKLPLQYPASLAKLRNLTVNIGPIRQMDLKSDMLHEILTLSDNFEVKFELKDKKDGHGRNIQEKSGFVRLPFEITTPGFLIRVARRLGDLHIDGRDMSVKFPEAFNKALDECKEYVEEVKRIRNEKFEMKKRQIAVKNVPANVSEDTIRSLFPEAQEITLNYEDLPDGGSKVGSVLLDFESEDACIQCLDTNKDVFIEDCQLKMFRRYSDKRYKTIRPTPMYARGRGIGRGRGMPQRGGFQVAKIRKRVLGFGGNVRGRGLQGTATRGNLNKKPIGNFVRKPAATSSPSYNMKSPGATGHPQASPRGQTNFSGGPRRRSSSGGRPGGYQSPANHDGQFRDFATPNRENIRGRGRARPYRGRGNRGGYKPRNEDRSPSFRGESSRQSPYRSDRSQPRMGASFRTEQRQSPSSSRDEDPRAMMEYLKSTIARMEEKMSTRDYSDRGYDRREESSPSSSYSGRGRGSVPRGRGRGRGELSRKRQADDRDYGQQAKRPYISDQDRRDSRGDYYSGHQQNMVTSSRQDSIGRAVRETMSDYRIDRNPSSHGVGFNSSPGNRLGSSPGDRFGSSHQGSRRESQDYRSGGYGNSERTRRDSFGGRSERVSSTYSGGQFGGGRGTGRGGRGQSRGRGYQKGNARGQLW